MSDRKEEEAASKQKQTCLKQRELERGEGPKGGGAVRRNKGGPHAVLETRLPRRDRGGMDAGDGRRGGREGCFVFPVCHCWVLQESGPGWRRRWDGPKADITKAAGPQEKNSPSLEAFLTFSEPPACAGTSNTPETSSPSRAVPLHPKEVAPEAPACAHTHTEDNFTWDFGGRIVREAPVRLVRVSQVVRLPGFGLVFPPGTRGSLPHPGKRKGNADKLKYKPEYDEIHVIFTLLGGYAWEQIGL